MQKNIYPGKFLVFEGLDGSGHSTEAQLLKDYLIKSGKKVFLTREPSFNLKSGKLIKKALENKKKISPRALQGLFTKNRAEHLKKEVVPALKKGKIVVCDRYFFSTFAYGAAEGQDLKWLMKINSNFLLPDLTFILKVSPRVCMKRIEGRGRPKSIFEHEKKLKKIWQTYKILPKKFKNVKIINGEKSIKQVFQNVKRIVKKELKI